MSKYPFLDEFDGVCCELDREIVQEGNKDCDHEYIKGSETDNCIHSKCRKCGREICYGIWE